MNNKNVFEQIELARESKALNLSNLNLTSLPEEIQEIQSLRSIDLKYNKLKEIPKWFDKFQDLITIDIRNNEFKNFPEVVAEIVKLDYLFLANNKIRVIPFVIKRLARLYHLDLSNNQIHELPQELGELRKLKILNLSGNKLRSLPKHIGQLTKLNVLDITNNRINFLPKHTFEFENLKEVDFKYGLNDNISIKERSGKIFIKGNPITSPPLELLTKNFRSISLYLDELKGQETAFLYEAKLLIVGEPGAGKTTLSKKILNPEYILDETEKSTEGIQVSKYSFIGKKGNLFKVNIWDFGGQEIYHATHQFFLTKRSLYILLSDTRAEDTDFNYWLQVIELLSEKSSTLIVQNEKQDRRKDINISGMRRRFRNLKDTVRTNLLSKRNLPELIDEIKHQLQMLPHIGTELPKTWIDIRVALEKLSEQHFFIRLDEYLKICSKYKIKKRKKALFLSDYLHDLGAFLHFQDNSVLKNYIILDTTWATDAVYKVIDNNQVIEDKGFFDKESLSSIWKEDKYIGMYEELLELMMKFELCYKIENSNTFIIPQLLSVNQPEYSWNYKDNISIYYDYEFMPKGIMTRLIVRLHHYIKSQNLVWKEGVVLNRNGADAQVIETYGKRKISITVKGRQRKELVIIILEELDKIHNSYKEIKVNKLIPCNCRICHNSLNPHLFKYASILNRRFKGKETIECDKSFENILIDSLIDETF